MLRVQPDAPGPARETIELCKLPYEQGNTLWSTGSQDTKGLQKRDRGLVFKKSCVDKDLQFAKQTSHKANELVPWAAGKAHPGGNDG